jgi:prepilin-type processing-associated H-X9-DG protein
MYNQLAGTNYQTNLATIDNVLSNQLGSLLVLSCPSDNAQVFQQTGSSYFWNNLLNGQDAEHLHMMGTNFAPTKIPLVLDKQSFHSALGSKNAVNYLYADGRTKTFWIPGGSE